MSRLQPGQMPIGVMDSGVGGISVLAALTRELPEENFLYYADFAHVPYGTKPVEEIRCCVDDVVDILMQRGIKALVIACNTATAAAAAGLRARLTLPIIGIEPALKPAAQMRRSGAVLVLGTPATLALPKFQRLMDRYGEGAIPLPCPGLMELVEAMDWRGAEEYLRSMLMPYAQTQVDAVVLGCTHYSFLRSLLRPLLSADTLLMDGNQGTARQLRHVLEEEGLLHHAPVPGVAWLYSGQEAGQVERMEQFYRIAKEAALEPSID